MICDVLTNNDMVIIDDDVHGRSFMTWQDALLRCKAVLEAEAKLRMIGQTAGKRWVPHIVRAAVKARQFSEPDWQPPASILDVPIAPKRSRILLPSDS